MVATPGPERRGLLTNPVFANQAPRAEALLMIDDVYTQKLNAGIYRFWKNDTSVKIARVDLRHLQLEVSGQELLTKDKAAIRINFFANYKVVNSEKAILDNKDYSKQLYVALQLSLRAFVGQYTLDELLSNKVTIAESVFTEVKIFKSHKILSKTIQCHTHNIISMILVLSNKTIPISKVTNELVQCS